MPSRLRQSGITLMYAAALAVFVAPLLAHAYVGLFTRYMADDYCTAAAAQVGLLEMQRHFYVGWSGRFSFTLTAGLVELLGPGVVPYLPAVLLTLWVTALAWAITQFKIGWRAALVLAEVIAFATLDDNSGGVYEALYWQTGSLTYLLPLVLITVLAGYVARLYFGEGTSRRVSIPFCCALAFYAGGFSEIFAAMQIAALASALAICGAMLPRAGWRRIRLALGAALVGSVLALALVAAAPGNQVRQATLPPRHGILPALRVSAQQAFAFIFSEHNFQGTAHLRLLALFASLLLGFALCGREGKRSLPALLVIPAATFIVVMACLTPAYYVMSKTPPPRALITPQFILVCGIASWGCALGAMLRQIYPKPSRLVRALCAALVVAFAAAPLLAARKTLVPAGKARALAVVWDRQDAEIRAAVARGERRLTVPVLYNVGGTDLMNNDPRWYVNACAAAYYGAEAITAVPGGEGGRVMFGDDLK